MKMEDKRIKSVDIINITKISEVLTGQPTYLRLKGKNKRLPKDYEYQVSELLSLVEGWLVKYNK